MQITYIHHSGFLVETDHFYYLFDYETGRLPVMDVTKPNLFSQCCVKSEICCKRQNTPWTNPRGVIMVLSY